jgi:exo-beta-1,3-glucanase (GH17 family)
MKRAAVLAVAAIGALCGLWYWLARGAPVAPPDLIGERLPCVSYAPFHRPGQSPFVKGLVISPTQIDADLAALARRTACVRTYSVDQGLDEVPRLARKHGMRVLLGLWIGRDETENAREIARGLEVIRRDADAIDAVIVGNEVLLRRELPAASLRKHIDRVRLATRLPVTYADVWEFWLRHGGELADAVSFVTVHLLPYWEDDPVPIERAVNHVVRVHAHVRAAFPGKDIFVGEAGWPSRGRQREGAVPSLVNQARFVRELAAAATSHGLRYNVIEAFDQPWKRQLEGTVGGSWGLLDADGRDKFPLRGPVVEDAGWMRGLVAAGIGAAALVLLAFGMRSRPTGAVLLALVGAGTGAALSAQLEVLERASRNTLEWTTGATLTAVAVIATLAAAASLSRWTDGRAATRPASVAAVAEWLKTNTATWSTAERSLGALRFALLFAAGAVALALVFDPRYRDFPLALFAPPAVAFVLLAWAAPSRPEIEERVLATVLAVAAPLIVLREGVQNIEALAWSASCLALAVGVWRARCGRPREDQQPEQKADRAGPGRVQREPGGAEAGGSERPG